MDDGESMFLFDRKALGETKRAEKDIRPSTMVRKIQICRKDSMAG